MLVVFMYVTSLTKMSFSQSEKHNFIYLYMYMYKICTHITHNSSEEACLLK